MKQKRFRHTTVILLFLVCLLALVAVGCTWSSNLKSCQKQNQALNQQIADLEYQLAQADEAAVGRTVQMAPSQTSAENATYLVVAGDSLWSIAKRQLGSGTRFKEIQALNPQVTPNNLIIGTTLKLPPK